MLSNKKNKFSLIILFSFFYGLCCIADDLTIKITNLNQSDISVKFLTSNISGQFEQITINHGETKKLKTDFDEQYYLNLEIDDLNSEKITDFQIFNNFQYNKDLEYFVPGGGSLENWGCAWNKNRILINKIIGCRCDPWISWLPFTYPSYHAEVSLTIIPENETIKSNDTKENPLEFTLFAVPKNNTVKEIQINTDIEKSLDINSRKLTLENWDIQEYVNLAPITYKTEKTSYSRWVDMILHNYTANSFILYGIDEKPKDEHIEFAYKENFMPNFTVFYPPQTQLRGPGFKFTVNRTEDNFVLNPNYPENEKDRFFLIIGQQTDLSKNTLEYIPVEVKSGIRLGKVLEGGARVNSFEDFAYQVEFIPVNTFFYINTVKPDEISDKIRVPLDENGKLMFRLSPMKNISVKSEKLSSESDIMQQNRIAAKYIISGISDIDNKQYSFRLILIAPPFIAGNTPGKFSPGQNLPPDIDIGNYLRYPLHTYIMSVNNDEKEENIEGFESITELPEEIIGSIEYFVTDLNHNHKNIEEEKEENKK